jgi:hypothetical protein
MKIFKQILLILILALMVIACEDEATSPDVKKPDEQKIDTVIAVPVGIDTCEYALITEFAGTKPFSKWVDINVYDFGFTLVIKLTDSTKPENLESLSVNSGAHNFSFDKNALSQLYKDSINGFVVKLNYASYLERCDSTVKWSIKLFDSVIDTSFAYEITTDFKKSALFSTRASWETSVQLKLYAGVYPSGADMKINVNYLDANKRLITSGEYAFSGDGVSVSNVPEQAAYYTCTFTDMYEGIKRISIFDKYAIYIPDRLPNNIDYINAIEKPSQAEYIESMDKTLILSSANKTLSLINYSDNSIVWEKTYSSSPVMFSYYKGKNIIYLAFTNGDVFAIDPAAGNGSKLFSAAASETVNFILPTNAGCFLFYEHSKKFAFYNSATKKVTVKSNPSLEDAFGSGFFLYNPYNERIYARFRDYIYSYTYDTVKDSLITYASVYDSRPGIVSYSLRLNPAGTKLYAGTAKTYECSPKGQSGDLTSIGQVGTYEYNFFSDLAFISDNSLIGVMYSYPCPNISTVPCTVEPKIFASDGVLSQTAQASLVGSPMEVAVKSGAIKVYSSFNEKLIVEKFNGTNLTY